MSDLCSLLCNSKLLAQHHKSACRCRIRAATVVQFCWRHHAARKRHLHMVKAVVKLQSFWRGQLARRDCAAQKAELQEQQTAELQMQQL